MTIVRVILVETTLPVKMRPRIETLPVKGHFLSEKKHNHKLSESKCDECIDIPMYVPWIASEGVLNPRPTSLYHRFSFVATFLPPSPQ